MSTTDPTGEGGGGGGGGGEGATTTNVEQNASPSTPITGATVPVQAAAQQQQQQQHQHPPPSPLSGCYLLVVLPEPHTAQHKDLILNRLAKGFLSWDKDSCHVDLEKELLALVAQAPEGEEARNGERLIQYATENLVTEVLIHPQTNTLLQCIRNLLASFTKHRHIIHAGYTFGGNGSWILQDGTFSLADFLDAFSEHEVQRVLRAYENSVTVDIHCAGVGDWTTSRLSKEACCRSCRVRVNPDDVLTAGVSAITSFTNYIGQYLVSQTLDQLMEPSDVVGNIRFSHPTLYVFPGGQGDAALFGINGFNMLVDGGFARKACFWDFTRHLDRLDAVLITRINNSNIGGMFSVLRKKKEMHVYPQIGHFFCNLVERRQSNSPDGDKDVDPLILNLTDIGQEMVLNLRHINLRAHPCYRDPDPINLYHKVGHGTLDMYVLSPNKDSREVREFLAKWHASDSKLFAGSHKKDTNNLTFPIQNLVSICALLVWQPANPEDNITRILFPGSTPQHKIFEGFERLKHLDFLKHPVCSAKTLSPSTSLATLRDKPVKKFSLIEKEPKKISELKREKREPSEPKSIKAADETVSKTPQSTPIIPTSKPKAEIKTKKVMENKKIETDAKESKKIELEAKESKKIEKELKEVKKEPKKESIKTEKPEKDDVKKTDLIKPESEKTALKEPKEPKEPKPKPEPKKKEAKESKTAVKPEVKKSEAVSRPKRVKPPGTEKKDSVKSSPTTPKKTLNGAATKTEISKVVSKAKPATKAAPSLPAKSAKEANNRKVVEQKKSEVEKSAVKDTAAPAVKVTAKPKPMDRKPISRRAKPISPSKARMPGSPAKSTRSTPTTSVKSDKDGVIRKVKGDKGTTDSSTVSTPSGIEPEVVKPIDKSLIEQSEDISLDSIESKVLADLKEEREVVEEIEAVLQKAERIEETRKDDRFEADDEITAEATDKKEEDITEEDVTAEIEDAPKKESSRKESQELTEEDEYLIVEKEEVYTEDSAQSGEGEQKHVLDEAESEKAKKDVEAMKEKGEKEEPEEKGKDETPEKKVEKVAHEDEEAAKMSLEHKEQLQEEVKEIIASAAEIVQKVEEKDDSGKKDSEDITKEPSSLSPDKLDSSEKKTTDTDMKPDADQKEQVLEKMEESQERISTIESGATTTAPTLPEDERIPLDEIKEDIDEKHVIEEVKEKDAPAKPKEEEIPEAAPVPDKPEVKVFDVRQAMQSLQRDIVKTPDEVADLPVHEEVDPKLYRMEDFEKGKEEKPSPTPQDVKEPPTPPVKEQKGVFSFFGKVADKFEKGIDKLTKKSKKDGEKDSDDKSSKSSSPKEVKLLEKTVLEEVDMEKIFPKVGKSDKPDTFEEAKPTIADVKVATIKETAAFVQAEILDAQRQSVPDVEEKLSPGKLEEIKQVEAEIEEATKPTEDKEISPTKPIKDKEIAKEIELLKEEDVGEDVEEVKALLEEASKKFKTVKDSLRDSLESLDEKIKEEEIAQIHEAPSSSKDAIKDTLEGVVEKLEVIKPHLSPDIVKEPEKVKFAIPKDEEFEEEYEEELEGPYRDMKEGIRDVGEVLAGTAGIILDDKPKDVTEIVKKVAEVLREDDFLTEKTLFDQEKEISAAPERKPSIPSEKISPEKATALDEKESKLSQEVVPTKVDITEEFPVQEEVEDLIEKLDKPSALYQKPGALEVKEEPCVKVVKDKTDITSPKTDAARDRMDAQKICAEMLKDDQHICDQHKKPADIDISQVDVMQAGIESVCVKKVTKRPSFEEIEQPVIGFEQKVSPAKAEIVMVTPGSTPTSPKFTTDKPYDEELGISLQDAPKLPEDVEQVLSKEAPVEEVIEELIITKKKKITIEIIEYITVVKRIPRERVIYIIEEIIVKKNLSRENVVDDPEILKVKEPITPEKRMEVEEYIVNEYIVKGKRITIEVVDEISIKKVVSKKIVVEIIEEIIVKRKIARNMVLDVPENVLSEIIKEESPEESPEESVEEQITPRIDITTKRESTTEVPSAPIEESIAPQKQTEIENLIVNEYIIKGRKITTPVIDEISTTKTVPKDILIEIIEEIIIRKKIPRNALLDIAEGETLTTAEIEEQKEAPKAEDEKRKSVTEVPSAEIPETEEPVTPQKRAEVEEYIVNEYVTKGDSINIQKLEEICNKKKVPKRIIVEIIEEIIIKRKMPRSKVLSVPEAELSRIIEEEALEPEISTEKRKSVAQISSPDKEKDGEAAEEEDVEEEVDGFVSIPRRISDEKVDTQKKADVSSIAAKEHEKDVIDDFEAVEQEYKVRDIPVTSPEKADEMREKEEAEETADDTTSDVIEADEKFVQETKEKIGKEEPPVAKDIKTVDEKREPEEPSEISEIVDTTEKYLDEAKEKTDGILPKDTVVKSVSPDEIKKIEPVIKEKIEEPQLTKDDKSKSTTPIKDEEDAEKVAEVKPETKLADATGFASPQEIPDEALRKKRSISMEPEDEISKAKDEPLVEGVAKPSEKIADEKLPADKPLKIDDIGTVKRMLVTASSEDGREETEICPTGSITFTKIVTPDDSLKDASVKSTPDKDSLLDKESLRSGVSTPEKDSISEKSVPEGKDKTTPEDSLEKPLGTRDSQDLEDSLEKSESRKPKVPEKLDDIAKPKSPAEKEEPKLPIEKALPESEHEKIAAVPKTPESLRSEDVSPAETIFSKSPTDKPEMYFAKTPISEEDVEEVSKKSPEQVADKKLPASTEKEQILDAAPTEKSRSPSISGEKPEEKDASGTSSEKSDEKEPSLRSKSPSIAGELPEDRIRSSSIASVKAEELKLVEPEEKIGGEKSRSSSITVEKLPEDIVSDKRHSVIGKEIIEPLDKSRSPSIVSDKGEKEDKIDKSRSPSIISETIDKEISERRKSSVAVIDEIDGGKPVEKSRSPSIADKTSDDKLKLGDEAAAELEKPEEKGESADKSKSPSIASEKSEQDIKSLDKSSVLSGKAEDRETDKPKSPSAVEREAISEKSPILESKHDEMDEKGPIDEVRSPSAISDKSDERKEADRSKSPSIAADKPDLEDVTEHYFEKPKSPIFDRPESPKAIDKTEEPQDKDRSPSVASDKSDSKKVSDHSRSPSISIEKVDSKVVDPSIERSRSPSVASVKDDKLERVSQSPPDIPDKSKSPSPVEQKLDIGEKGKSRSSSIVGEPHESEEMKQSPSPVGEKPDSLTQVSPIDKSRSSSITSVTDIQKELADRSKSPSIADEKPEVSTEKSRSPSVASTEQKESADRSKPPSIIGEKPDIKDVLEPPADKSRSSSVASAAEEQKEPFDRSKSPSVAGEKPDEKDVLEPTTDKSRSASVASITGEQKETDRSKSPSVAGEKPDLKDVTGRPDEKSRSPSVTGDLKEPGDRSKSPSIAGEKPDEKDVLEPTTDKSRSASVASITGEQKETDRSKSPSVAGEKPDLKDVTEQQSEKSPSTLSVAGEQEKPEDQKTASTDVKQEPIGRSKSPSIASEKSDDKKSTGDSKSSSIAGEKADLADVAEQPTDKSKPATVSDKKEELDRSKSPSVTSDKSEEIKSAISSKQSSVAGDAADLKEVLEPPGDKSRSPSVTSATTDQKESIEKAASPTIPQERSKSPSVASEKSDDKKSVDSSRATSVTEEKPDLKDVIEVSADKSKSSGVASLSTEKAEAFAKSISPIASDKLEPPVDQSKSSTVPDKLDIKPDDVISHDRSRSPSIVLDKPMEDDKQPTEEIDIDGLKTFDATSELDLPDKTRSLSIISDKTEPKSPSDASKSPSSDGQKDKSRSSSVASEKLDEPPEAKGERSISPSLDTGKKDGSAKSSRASSPEDKLSKDRSRSQSVFDAGDKTPAGRSRTASLLDEKLPEKTVSQEKDEHEDLPKKKSSITSPETIQKEMQKIREKRFADFDEPDAVEPGKIEKSDDEEEGIVKVTAEKRAEIEKYILEEYIVRKRKISLVVIEKLVMMYSVPQFIVMEIIEDIISRQNVPRNTVLDFLDDLREKSPDIVETKEKSVVPTSVDLGGIGFTQEHLHEKPSSVRGESPDGKVSPVGSDRYDKDARALSVSPSLSPEPIPSDKSTQDSPARSEPHIDEEIFILSEEKRVEIEKLLEEEYIKKGRKITEVILEELIIKTSLPRYIILEIVEEIIIKRKIPRESVIDVDIYQEEEPEEDYDKAMYRYGGAAGDGTADYALTRDARKPSVEYGMKYSQPGERSQEDKSDYPIGYESQFHKAFVGGMTEMRTTHITTLSGKSTPEFTSPESGVESADKASAKSPEHPLTTTHITKTDAHDLKTIQPMQTVTILRESKIGEPADEPEETAAIPEVTKAVKESVVEDVPESGDATERDDEIAVKKTIKHEIVEPQEQPEVITKDIKRPSVQHDEPEAITKIIKREIVEHDEPEVITKVVKREIIEQDEPEIITKVIRREIVVPDEEIEDSGDDTGEYVKTITTKTTRTIVTEELPDAELSQTDPSKIYTDPTSGATYRVVSDDGASDATASADVKRIVTTVTTITGPDGKVTTKKDVTESTDTVDSEELLEKLIDSGKITTETTKSAEKIIKETITSVTSGTSTPDVKAFYDSGKSTPDFKHEEKLEPAEKEHLSTEKLEHLVSPLVRDLISEDKSYSGKSSPDISLPKDIVFSGSTGKSTPEVPMSPLIRDGAAIQHHLSGRSTPDRRSDGRSSTATPEGFRSGEMIRTTITTTKTISDEGEIVTTTKEVTETTNEKGETVVLAEKTDVKVDERGPGKDSAESAISSIISSIKSSEQQRSGSAGSDDEPPGSPLSSTSQVGYEKEEEKQVEFSAAAMSGSFYGELPAVPPQISAMKTFHGETGMQKSSDPIPIHSRFMVEKEFAGGYGEKPDAKKYVDEADLDFDKALMERKEMKEASGAFSGGITPRYTNGSLRHETGAAQDRPSSSFRDDTKDDSKSDSKKDPLEGWGSPLGLPSPKPPRKFNLKNPVQPQPSCSSETTSDILNFDVMKDWGEPLRLPSPAPVTNEVSNKGAPSTPKKERKQAKKIQSENIKNKKRSESPGKNEKKMKDSKNKIQPVYMDLAYVPHHGNSYYTSLEFFKRVRARYYVFSGTEPSREVYDALLEAKKTWEDKELEVTMIPTYDTDTLGYWVADNEEALAANHIDLSPSASRCTINLQDHETSCSAYRLEF